MNFDIKPDFIKALRMIDTYVDICFVRQETEVIEKAEKYFSFMSAAADYRKDGNVEMERKYRDEAKKILKNICSE